MSSVGAKVSAEPGKPRPDFCIGDLDGTACAPEFTEFLVETIRGYGYSVTVNDPYRGGELIRRHSDPKNGVHSAQIEISKRLFMDVATFKKNEGFDRLKRSEEHTSELQSLMRISYAVFCLTKKKKKIHHKDIEKSSKIIQQ